jgi:uncharacterized protein (DUF2237 family)
LEVFVLTHYLTFRRTSGRDLSAVRRPRKTLRKGVAASMNKAELVEFAETAGLDTSGTKAELVERISEPEPDDG